MGNLMRLNSAGMLQSTRTTTQRIMYFSTKQSHNWTRKCCCQWSHLEICDGIGGHFKVKFCLFCLVVLNTHLVLSWWRNIRFNSVHSNRLLTLFCSDSDSFLRLELLLWIAVSSEKRSLHDLMNRCRSLMSIEKSNSPRAEPWGTP